MSQQAKYFYEFGDFRIDVVKRRLLRAGEIVPLAPKVFDLLLTLAEHSGRAIEKDELMQRVWPDTAVEENNLTQNIYTLRKIFGESRSENRFIATVPGFGYRFVAEVNRVPLVDEEVSIKENTEAHILITETFEDEDVETPPNFVAGAPELRMLPPVAVHGNKRNRVIAIGALGVLIAGAAIFGILRFLRAPDFSADAFRKLTLDQVTRTGTIPRASISPDGKHVFYSVREGDRESLWLRQLATGSVRQIVPPEDSSYMALSYSHDGNYVYFIKRKLGEDNVLYKMPALGGIPARLGRGMEAFISLSPDDQRIAFVRDSESESVLIVANSDGSEERRLAVHKLTDYFKVPSWSPDGKMIACSTGTGETYDNQNTVVGIRVDDGKEVPLTTERWSWTRWVEWLGDGSGLLLTARDLPTKPVQIWHVSYPGGQARRITNDSKEYLSLSLTADCKTLAAIQTELLSEIWVSSVGDDRETRKITFGTGSYGDVCFGADGKIIYSSFEGGNLDLWRMNADGSDKQQLTSDPGVDTHQAVSLDARYIVFASDRAGVFNVWRIDNDGSNPVRLTSGTGEKFPNCSPDGKWVIFNSVGSDETLYSLWKVPIEGGPPVLLAEHANKAAISPDGAHIAYFSSSPGDPNRATITVIPFGGGQPEHIFEFPPNIQLLNQVHWTANSEAVLYIVVRGGISNIWMQPLDGAPARQVTNFKFEGALIFDLSPDGKRLVFTRRQWAPDLYLLTNFR